MIRRSRVVWGLLVVLGLGSLVMYPGAALAAANESPQLLELGDQVLLHPIVQAQPGASQGYIVTGGAQVLVSEEARALLFAEGAYHDAFEEPTKYSAYVNYTVLPPGPSGEVRLAVDGFAIDAATGRPIAMPHWHGVLVGTPPPSAALPALLTLSPVPGPSPSPPTPPLSVVWEDGNQPTWAYELGITLDWLREWRFTPDEAARAVAPGMVWSGESHFSHDVRFEGLEMQPAPFEVVGTFDGWISTGDGKAAAQVVEHYSGRLESALARITPEAWCLEETVDESFEYYIRWLDQCLEAVVQASLPTAMDVEGTTHIWLMPGDFPWAAAASTRVELHFALDEVPSVFLEYTSHVQRQDEPVEPGRIIPIASGERLVGQLGSASWIAMSFGIPTTSPSDVYSFWGEAGQDALIEMRSDAFDAYLVVTDDAWNVLWENDNTTLGTDAGLFVNLPYTGAYLIQALAWDGPVEGEYTLALDVGSELVRPDHVAFDPWGWDWGWDWEDDWWLDWDWEDEDLMAPGE